jgi:hypothetical protein
MNVAEFRCLETVTVLSKTARLFMVYQAMLYLATAASQSTRDYRRLENDDLPREVGEQCHRPKNGNERVTLVRFDRGVIG